MSFNVHQLLHLPCLELGPSLGSINFLLKRNGGRLLRMFSGTKHVSLQVCKSLILFQEAKSLSTQCLNDATDDINLFVKSWMVRSTNSLMLGYAKHSCYTETHFRPLSLLEQIAVVFFFYSVCAFSGHNFVKQQFAVTASFHQWSQQLHN